MTETNFRDYLTFFILSTVQTPQKN